MTPDPQAVLMAAVERTCAEGHTNGSIRDALNELRAAWTAYRAEPMDAIVQSGTPTPDNTLPVALALLASDMTTDLELLRDLRLAFEPDEGMATSFDIEHNENCPASPINGSRAGRSCICGLDETIRRVHDTEEALRRLHSELVRIAKAVQS